MIIDTLNPEVNSLKNEVLELQRQVKKAGLLKYANKILLPAHVPLL